MPGFFTETTAGVYQSRGARLAVMAGPGVVRFGELTLKHKAASFRAPLGVDATGGIVNTYTATRADTHRPAYRAVEYRDIYPGITLRLSFEGRAVKADYLVAPGADPRVIRFCYEGATARLEAGDLIAGEIRQPAPTVLQGSTELPSRYVIGRDGWVRFVITGHDRSKPMVIDPYVITRSAYLGGALTDRIAAVAVDTSGYLYITGSTESTDFPVGSIRTRVSGVEAYVLKLNPLDLQVVYATYIGGSAEDRASFIVVDGSGSVYFAGFTASSDFPASLGPNGGSTDGFVARLTASGTLQFATFLGGSRSDLANGLALNTDGSVWVVGETDSADMPLRGIPYQAVNRGGFDAFLARVNADGSVAYAGYFGGTGEDRAVAVAVDSAGEVYFTGGTASATQFPVANAFRSYSGMQDAFVAKLSADGGTLRYSTHLGGSGGSVGQPEVGNWIGVDANGAAMVVGITGSTDFPVTGSAFQPTFGGGATDGFVSKISAAGTSLLYSTYFGGTSTDEAWSGALSADGTFYFGGNTSSPAMPSVEAIQAQGGDIDGFFAKLSSNLSTLLTFSYLGYTGTDSLSAIALSPPSIVLAGSSSSPSWLSSGGFKGWYDGWVMTLSEAGLAVQINSSPSGMAFTVSGSGCSPGSATTPATLGWSNGASCTVSLASTQGTGDTRSLFQGWSDGSLANPRTIVASNGASYTMQFATEHRLTRTASPTGAGVISGIDGFYSAGTNVNLSASANAGYQFAGWSGAVATGTNPITVAMDAPKAVTASFNLVTTFHNTAPVALTVTGTGCAAGTYATAATALAWTPGASCSVGVPSSQVSGDTRWVFARWSDGSTANPRSFTAAVPNASYHIEWNVEYKLTRLVTPSATGTVSGADGFYAASSTVPLTATPASSYLFGGWSGDASGTANPLFVVMNGPKSITANFVPRTSQITIESNAASLQFTVSGSGCNPGTYSAPQVFAWPEGGVCVISISAVQGGDVRWVFEGWADGPTSNPRSVTVGASAAAYTMQFGTQYRLTRSLTGQGSMTGADGFYAAGSNIELTATAANGYQFTGWSGNIVSAANPLTFTMSSPSTITANFSAAPTTIAFSSNVTGQITVGGSGCPAGTYTVPTNIVWTNGTTCSVAVTSPYGGPDTRWVFANWTDGSTSNPRAITASPGATYTLAFTPEHKLVRNIAGDGTVSGADGFYPAGSSLQLSAAAASGYSFSGWSGSASGASNPLTLAMDGPKTVIASFTAGQAGVRIEANLGVPFSVTGSGCPGGTYTAPATVTWTTGTNCAVTVLPPDLGPDARWIFSRWADGPTGNPRVITASPGAVYTIVIAVEYRLTRSTSGAGSVSGADGWYAAGSALQLAATAAPGYQFTSWSGTAGGSANPLNILMDGPKAVIASFTPVPSGVRIETNLAVTFNVAGAGCPAGAYTAPATLTWTTGVTCEIIVQQPAAGSDTRWIFLRWADGPTSNLRSLTANPGVIYTIVMAPEYRLTRLVSGAGSVSGADGFYASGSSVSLTATPSSGQQLVTWSGSASGAANPLTIAMDGPKVVTAVFAGAPTPIRIESNISAQINVSGSGCPAGTYTAPVTLTWATGMSCDVSIPSPQGGGDTRWVFNRWSDGPTANVRAILASVGAVYTLVLSAEHRLTRSVSGPGSVTGADGFYAAGSTVQLAANPTIGYQFAGWTGSASGTSNPLALLMNGPKSVTASFSSAATNVRIEANVAMQFSVTGSNCPVGNYMAPATVTWSNGTICNVSVPSPQGGQDTRLVFTGWTDGVSANPRPIAASPGAVYAFLAGTEHRLTRTVAGEGSVSGADGFYAAGSTISLTAAPAASYQFAGWSGSGGGSANPLSIHINGPTLITANFTPIPVASAAVETLNPLVGSGPSGTFTATFSHGLGADELYLGYMLFLPTSNVVNYVATGSCLVEYNRISHGMRLIDDAGTGWLGPVSGVVIGPNAGTLSNSKCTVNVAGSSASRAGNVMTVKVPIVFKNGVSPVMGTFLQALDVKGNWTGMTQFGNWTLSTGTPRPGPSIAGVANSTTVGSYAVYSIAASHTSGASSLAMIHLLLNDSITKGAPCQAVYFPGNNTLNLINDTGTDLVAPSGVVPGTPGTIANSRCAINTGLASRSVAAKSVTVTIPLNLQVATFGGEKKVYVNAFDNVGQLTHWVQASTLMVQ